MHMHARSLGQVGRALLCYFLLAAATNTTVVYEQAYALTDSGCTGNVVNEIFVPVDMCSGAVKYSIVGGKVHQHDYSDNQCTNLLQEEEIDSSSCVRKQGRYFKTSALDVESDKWLLQYMQASSTSSCSSAPQGNVFLSAFVQDRCNIYKLIPGTNSEMYYCTGGLLHRRTYNSADCSGTPGTGTQVGGGGFADVNQCMWTQKTVQCGNGNAASHAEIKHPGRRCAWVFFFGLAAIWANF